MAAPTLPPAPLDTPLTKDDGRPSPTWARWFQLLGSNLKTQTFSQTITVPDDWVYVGVGSGPAFQGGFSNYDAAWTPASFKKNSAGTVIVRGLVKTTAHGTIFTLPSAYRPALNVGPFAQMSSGPALGYMQSIASSGILETTAGGIAFFNIDREFEAADCTPIVPSCFPFDVASSLQGEATWLEVARVRETGSGANVSPGVVHWEPVESGGTRYHRIKNIACLTPNKTYEITFVAGAS